MKWFKNLSIKGKIMAIVTLTSFIALAAASTALIAYESVAFRKALAGQITTLSQITGKNCSVALTVNQPLGAEEVLANLTADPQIKGVCIFDKDGRLWAKFPASTKDGDFPKNPEPSASHPNVDATGLHVFTPILDPAGVRIGTIYIHASLDELRARITQHVAIVTVLSLVALLVAFGISAKLQTVISKPILHLAETARAVSENKNYGIRAEKQGDDEVGTLINSFNDMLVQIQQRDAELHQAREAAEQAREAAEKANLLKSKFLSVMSHELRTPLSIIIQFLDMVLPGVEAEKRSDWANWLSRSLGQAHHMLNQINDILDISRIEAGKMEVSLRECEISQIVEGGPMSGMTYLIRRNNNRLVVDCVPDAGKMWTDLDKVQRCLINLLGNASKFTKNGTVTLSVRRWKKDNIDWVTFRVEDTGKGMTAAELGLLFRPFSQVSADMGQQFGGHGLGLAITKDLCQRLGGDVRAESEPGKGSVFIIDLPASRTIQEPSSQLSPQDAVMSAVRATNGCVLVIDDDPEMRQVLSEMLTREGFRVEFAASGEEGLKRAKELQPAVITLDVLMPDIDGWTVMCRLKADPELAAIPVVMISVWPESERAFALGVAEYLSKPIDSKRLISVLKKYYSAPPNNHALVVEDDPDMRSLLKQMLEDERWDAGTAENGQSALEQIRRVPPSVILLDLMMPVMDGFQLVAELQKHEEWRRIPVVVISAKDLTLEEKERLGGPVIEILKKGSFGREELLQTVRQTVRQLLPGSQSDAADIAKTSEKSAAGEKELK